LESWACAQKIAAAQEMIRRRPDQRAAALPAAAAGDRAADPGALPPVWDRTLGEELALELSLSVYSGLALAELSYALKNRLPLTAAALEDGTLDLAKVRLIASEAAVLTDEQARAAEAEIAGRWEGLTWAELRDLVTTAVINADPEGARKRREEASKDARYRFCLDRGALTATLAGYSLPSADAIRADQRVRSRARGYRRHGIEGTFDQLCALAYLDLLTGRDARDRIPQGPAPDEDEDDAEAAWDSRLAAGPGQDEDEGWDGGWADGPVPDDPDATAVAGVPCPDQPVGPDQPAGPCEPARPATGEPAPETGPRHAKDDDAKDDDAQDETGEDDDAKGQDDEGQDDEGQDDDGNQDGGNGGPGGNGGGPGPGGCGCGGSGGGTRACDDGLAANVDLIVPLADLTGYAQRAAQVRNLGGIDPDLARTLTGMAARTPGSTFRVIITGPDRRTVAFGQATPVTTVTPGTGPPAGRHTRGSPLPFPSPEQTGDPPDTPGVPMASFAPAPGSPDQVSSDQPTGSGGYGRWRLRIGGTLYAVRLDPVPGPGPCDHGYQVGGYQPGPVLRRLAEVRDGVCMLPGCNRSPRRCESEHARPWPGGATCSCNLGLNCKKHNLMKKDPRWQVTQKPDGARTWITPGGLSYTRKPKTYPS
jgi:Domain of unknown function (DUF222)